MSQPQNHFQGAATARTQVADFFKEESMPDCSCANNMKASFYCQKEPKCNGGQVYYCASCCDHHDHRSIVISKRVNEMAQEWHSIFEEVNQIVARAQAKFSEF